MPPAVLIDRSVRGGNSSGGPVSLDRVLCQNGHLTHFPEGASMKLSFLDVHLSQVVRGVAATASEGVLVYHVFVSPEALLELGATEDTATWVPAFHRNETLVAAHVKAMRRAAPDAPAIIESLTVG